MEIAEHITLLHEEGELLAAAAQHTHLDTPIPACPEWRMRDLLRHIGGVHRWAAANVGQPRTRAMDEREEAAVIGTWPDDNGLVDWFREGHALLSHTLEMAHPNLACWTFLPAPSPLAFWARRQAHETAMHRADAEGATGAITAFAPRFAADGIDELLFGFVSRPSGTLRAEPPRIIQIQAKDADRAWRVLIGPKAVEVQSEDAGGDCKVRGGASDLYLLLWNRRNPEGLEICGDATLLDLWRQSVRIRWS